MSTGHMGTGHVSEGAAVGQRPFRHEAGTQAVRFGWGEAVAAVGEEVTALGAQRILAVCGTTGRPLVDSLASVVPVVSVMDEIRQHVPVPLAERARAHAADVGADLVLAVGGGSATGLAKAIAMTTGLPSVVVPTTYSGSEATPVWGLTEDQRKWTGIDLRVLPRVIVYDAALTLGLSAETSVTSGLNAMAHCVDALWAPRANPVADAFAVEGVRAMASGLPAVRADGGARDGRDRCLLGAYLSGLALASAGSGLHHKICHVLGGAYGLPHAATHSVLLPHTLAFNAPFAPGAVARLADGFGANDPVAALAGLVRQLEAPTALRDLGMPEDGIDAMAEHVVAAAPLGNPRPVTTEAIRGLLADAWMGRTPQILEKS